METLATYVRLIGISIQSQLQYRASIVIQSLGQFVIIAVEALAAGALFIRFGSIAGWRIGEAAFLYGFAEIVFTLADALSGGLDQMSGLVKRGDFDRVLLRPCPALAQVMGAELSLRRIGKLVLGLMVLGFGWVSMGWSPSPTGIVALFLGLTASVSVFVSLFVIQAAFAFRTIESLEFMNALTYGGRQTTIYPLEAYGRGLRAVFLALVPIGATLYLPVCLALGREPFPGWPWWAGLVGPLAALPFSALAIAAWRSGMRYYASTGS